jgi:predicted nucleotidyltransferase
MHPSKLEKTAQRFHLAEIYAFGSRAKEILARFQGEAPSSPERPQSDVDIGVQPEPGRKLSVEEKVDLAIELEDLLDAPRVDLVVLPEANPFLAADIICGELLYCKDPVEQAERELYILRRAGDLEPLRRERIRLILEEGGR